MWLETLRHHLSAEEVDALLAAVAAPRTARNRELAALVCKALTLDALAGPTKTTPDWTPNTLIQYWDQVAPPADVMACVASWRTGSALKHQLFSDVTARSFIASHYCSQHLDAFEHCHHPAMRSDYFRLAYISLMGGVYVDADEMRLPRPLPIQQLQSAGLSLRPIFRDASGGMISTEKRNSIEEALASGSATVYLANDPLIARPGHPVVLGALARATRLILQAKSRGETGRIHWTTGPDNVTLAVVDYALSCLRREAPVDVQILTTWTDFAQWQGGLAYRRTARNWRTDRPTEGPSQKPAAMALAGAAD